MQILVAGSKGARRSTMLNIFILIPVVYIFCMYYEVYFWQWLSTKVQKVPVSAKITKYNNKNTWIVLQLFILRLLDSRFLMCYKSIYMIQLIIKKLKYGVMQTGL